jgi:endo-1,4-beta-xylanase
MKKKLKDEGNRIMNKIAIFVIIYCLSSFQAKAGPIAEGADKFLGNICESTPPSNFLNYWNQITLENNGKWINVEKSRDNMTWGNISNAYNYCQQNKIPFKHHCFIWKEQAPDWLPGLPAADLKAEVEEWIKSFGEKFPETAYIDVVNESREKSPPWKTALGGDGETGCDWIVWAFETARKYCPKAKLLINEYYCEYSLDFVTQYLKIINVLKAKNLIDGIGLQSHDGETKKGYTTGMLKKCLDSLATSGIPLYSTEFDMSGNDTEQLNYYKNIFPIFWEHPAVKGMTLWGWTDSWLLHMSTPKDGRLMVNGQERPALKWLREYVASHKKQTTASKAGSVKAALPQVTVDRACGNSIRIHLAEAQDVSLHVVSPSGRTVFSQTMRPYSKGSHIIFLPQRLMAQGIYMVMVKGKQSEIKQKLFVGL